MANDRVFAMSFASVYPHYVKKAETKGRTKDELDEVIRWLTGYTKAGLAKQIEKRSSFPRILREGPKDQSQRDTDQRRSLRDSCGKHRRSTDAKDPVPGQTDRRTGKRKEDGKDFAELISNE